MREGHINNPKLQRYTRDPGVVYEFRSRREYHRQKLEELVEAAMCPSCHINRKYKGGPCPVCRARIVTTISDPERLRDSTPT